MEVIMIIVAIIVVMLVVFILVTNGNHPVEKMLSKNLEKLEKILTRQLVLNAKAGNLGTDKDMKDREQLKAVCAEIEKRKGLGRQLE